MLRDVSSGPKPCATIPHTQVSFRTREKQLILDTEPREDLRSKSAKRSFGPFPKPNHGIPAKWYHVVIPHFSVPENCGSTPAREASISCSSAGSSSAKGFRSPFFGGQAAYRPAVMSCMTAWRLGLAKAHREPGQRKRA